MSITQSHAWKVSGGRCYYCRVLLSKGTATRDHKIPKSRGGRQFGNLVLACQPCNAKKGNMNWLEFLKSPWLIERMKQVEEGTIRSVPVVGTK